MEEEYCEWFMLDEFCSEIDDDDEANARVVVLVPVPVPFPTLAGPVGGVDKMFWLNFMKLSLLDLRLLGIEIGDDFGGR